MVLLLGWIALSMRKGRGNDTYIPLFSGTGGGWGDNGGLAWGNECPCSFKLPRLPGASREGHVRPSDPRSDYIFP